jgi:hypothetical protein
MVLRALRGFVGGELEQGVEGVAGDAESDRGDAGGEGAEEGLAVERGVDGGGGEEGEAVGVRGCRGRGRRSRGCRCRAGRGVPGVVDLDLVAADEQAAELGFGGVAGVDEGAAHEPVGVLAAAAERPAAGHAVAVGGPRGAAERGEHAAGDHVGWGVDGARGGGREEGAHERGGHADHGAPAGGAVGAGDGLDEGDGGGDGGLGAAVLRGDEELEGASLDEGGDDVGGEATGAFDGVGLRADEPGSDLGAGHERGGEHGADGNRAATRGARRRPAVSHWHCIVGNGCSAESPNMRRLAALSRSCAAAAVAAIGGRAGTGRARRIRRSGPR